MSEKKLCQQISSVDDAKSMVASYSRWRQVHDQQQLSSLSYNSYDDGVMSSQEAVVHSDPYVLPVLCK